MLEKLADVYSEVNSGALSWEKVLCKWSEENKIDQEKP